MTFLQKIPTKTLKRIMVLGLFASIPFSTVLDFNEWYVRVLLFVLFILQMTAYTLWRTRCWREEGKNVTVKLSLFLGALALAFLLIYAIIYGLV